MNKSRSLAILAALVLSGAGQARAENWSGLISNDWFFPLNWSSFAGPPAANEDAVFPASATGGFPVSRTDVNLSMSTTVAAWLSPVRSKRDTRSPGSTAPS